VSLGLGLRLRLRSIPIGVVLVRSEDPQHPTRCYALTKLSMLFISHIVTIVRSLLMYIGTVVHTYHTPRVYSPEEGRGI